MHGFPVRKRHNSEVHSKFRGEPQNRTRPFLWISVWTGLAITRSVQSSFRQRRVERTLLSKRQVVFIHCVRFYHLRPRGVGRQFFSNEDSDVYGAQQHGPLMDVELPI